MIKIRTYKIDSKGLSLDQNAKTACRRNIVHKDIKSTKCISNK